MIISPVKASRECSCRQHAEAERKGMAPFIVHLSCGRRLSPAAFSLLRCPRYAFPGLLSLERHADGLSRDHPGSTLGPKRPTTFLGIVHLRHFCLKA